MCQFGVQKVSIWCQKCHFITDVHKPVKRAKQATFVLETNGQILIINKYGKNRNYHICSLRFDKILHISVYVAKTLGPLGQYILTKPRFNHGTEDRNARTSPIHG